MPTIPTPPLDKSGGFLLISYGNGTYSHTMRAHVQAFNTPASSGASGPDPAHGYVYNTPPTGAQGEVGTSDTFTALCNVLAPFMGGDYVFSLNGVYQNLNNAITPVFPTPTPAAVHGTNSGGNPTPEFPAGEWMYNFRTSGGNRARIVLIGAVSWAAQQPQVVSATAGGGAAQQALVAYATSPGTRLVGHDGNPLIGPAKVTFPVNRRLRRHYRWA
jgi:hypothetical protein